MPESIEGAIVFHRIRHIAQIAISHKCWKSVQGGVVRIRKNEKNRM